MSEHPLFQSLAIEFRSLDVFQAVYVSSSMTTAAIELDMTQSAVSQSIKRLEENLGVSLFERSRPLVPTTAADELKQQADILFGQVRQIEKRVREQAKAVHPSVRIGMVDSFTATIGPRLIPRLRGKSERLTVWSGISRTLERELLSGKLDLLVGSQPMSQERNVRTYPLIREPFIVVLPERIAASMKRSVGEVRLRDLVQNHTFVRYSQRSKIGSDIEAYLEDQGLRPPRSMEFDGTEAAYAMVNGGLGWMVSTPLCLIHGAGVEPGLTAVPLPDPAPERALYLLARREVDESVVRDTLANAHEVMRQTIDERLRELAPWAADKVKMK